MAKTPFGWVGGKSRLAAQIIERFPPHRLYCEVFAGALNVLYAKPPGKIEVANDANGELVNLHRQIRDRPVSLSSYLQRLLNSREIFHAIKEGRYRTSNDIERAACYFFRIYQSFGSAGQHFSMAKRKAPKSLWRDFIVYSRRLKNVCIERLDFEKLIREYDSPDSFFYVDPPYYGTEDYYEGKHFGKSDHERLRDVLANAKGKWLLSYNDCEAIRELYGGFAIDSLSARYTFGSSNGRIAEELLIANY